MTQSMVSFYPGRISKQFWPQRKERKTSCSRALLVSERHSLLDALLTPCWDRKTETASRWFNFINPTLTRISFRAIVPKRVEVFTVETACSLTFVIEPAQI